MPNNKPRIFWILVSIVLASCSYRQQILKNDFTTVVEGLQIQTFGDVSSLDSPVVLVFLHSDACVADYMTTMAKTVVRKNILSFVMARPGCVVNNRRSIGNHGNYDHYTAERIDAVSNSVRSLRDHYKASKVFLIGHSGGAVTAGIVAGRHPDLVNGFVAIAFPANIPDWRRYRKRGEDWKDSLSPHDYVNDIKQSTLLFIVNGSEDDITPPSFSVEYADTAASRGLSVENIVLDGENHRSSFHAHKVWSIISSLTYD